MSLWDTADKDKCGRYCLLKHWTWVWVVEWMIYTCSASVGIPHLLLLINKWFTQPTKDCISNHLASHWESLDGFLCLGSGQVMFCWSECSQGRGRSYPGSGPSHRTGTSTRDSCMPQCGSAEPGGGNCECQWSPVSYTVSMPGAHVGDLQWRCSHRPWYR